MTALSRVLCVKRPDARASLSLSRKSYARPAPAWTTSSREKDLLARRPFFDRRIREGALVQRPRLYGRWSQMAFVKAHSKPIHDLRNLGTREPHGIDADESPEVVIEVHEVEFDATAPDARDGRLATAGPQRLQAPFEQRAADGIEHEVDALA